MPSRKPRTADVRVVRLAHAVGLPLPEYQSAEAAGLDLLAAVDARAPVTLAPGARALIPTGLVIDLPQGCEAQVRPRSGLALRHGITVLNSPGTIDSDYRGEVKVLLVNLGTEPFEIRRGDRIAQLVVASVVKAKLALAKSLSQTARGPGGFGSTIPNGTARKKNPAKASRTTHKSRSRRGPV
jgi:dUTP pyrophosphatase